MPLYQSHAFVLRTYKLGDTDQIVVFFTREYGKIRAVARRSHSPSRRLAGYCQPLRLLHAILFGKPSQSLFRVNSLDLMCPFQSIHADFSHLRSGLYFTELIDAATREFEPEPELFSLLQWSLQALSRVERPFMLLRSFELRLSMILGYAPQVEVCANCMQELSVQDGRFSADLGGLLCASCTAPHHATMRVSRSTVALLRQMIDRAGEAATDQLLATESETELQHLLHAHLRARLGRELKSYAFLSL